MNYYIQGNKEKADQIKAAFEKLGVASNANRYNYKNDYVLYFSAGGMMHMIDANGSWANIIKTHPDYTELELPVEPKFKVGDWLVYKYDDYFTGGLREVQVVKVEDGVYFFHTGTTGSWEFIDKNCRIIGFNPIFYIDTLQNKTAFKPATKEQRDLLFAKMKEAGYEWDANKKKLRKIKPHYNISNFNPFDKVLVRQDDSCTWGVSFFGRYDGMFICCSNACFTQCIPFEGNEHLLGTTDMCDEMYINW